MKILSRFFDLSELDKTIRRFPVCFIFAILMFVMAFLQVNKLVTLNEEWLSRIYLFLITGFFWAGAIKIVQESQQWPTKKYIGILSLGLILDAVLLMIGSKDNPDFILTLAHLVVVNFILLCIAPFLGRKSTNASLWEYNRRLWIGVSLAIIASLIFWAGFSGVLASIGYLFGFTTNSEIYFSLWCFAAILLAPLYALSNVPRQFIFQNEDCELKASLTFLVKWIMLPLVFIYFLILYAYFAKILILMEIPKGQLAWIILGFSAAGIITFIIAWPYQATGQKIFVVFKKAFFPLLVIPSIMLAISIAMRIDEYGFTPQRFYLCVIAAYLIILSLVMSFRGDKLKTIFGLAIVLILLTSTPLFNALKVAEHSQRMILENTMIKYNLYKDGAVIQADVAQNIALEDRRKISGAYDYLSFNGDRENHADQFYGYKTRNRFFEALGFEYLSAAEFRQSNLRQDNSKFNYYLNYSDKYGQAITVTGYDEIFRNMNFSSARIGDEYFLPSDDMKVTTSIKDNMAVLTIGGEDISLNAIPFIQTFLSDNRNMTDVSQKIRITGESASYVVDFDVISFDGDIVNGEPALKGMSGQTFIRRK